MTELDKLLEPIEPFKVFIIQTPRKAKIYGLKMGFIIEEAWLRNALLRS
jgi:hypothetical protein